MLHHYCVASPLLAQLVGYNTLVFSNYMCQAHQLDNGMCCMISSIVMNLVALPCIGMVPEEMVLYAEIKDSAGMCSLYSSTMHSALCGSPQQHLSNTATQVAALC